MRPQLQLLSKSADRRYYTWAKDRGTAMRPWRLYGTKPDGKHGPLPWRSFGTDIHAHNAAMIDVRWGAFRAIEVYDVRTGKESGTYAIRDGDIKFSAPAESNIIKLLEKKGVI